MRSQGIWKTAFQLFHFPLLNTWGKPNDEMIVDISQAMIAGVEVIDALHGIVGGVDPLKQ